MAGIGVTPTTARQRLVLVTAALVAAVALVMIAQLNGLLAGSRVDGGVAGSVSDLSVSLLPAELPDEAEILSVVGSWKAYDTEVVQARPELGYSSPVATANAVLRLDAFLLIPVYAIFALTLLLWARSWPPPPAGPTGPTGDRGAGAVVVPVRRAGHRAGGRRARERGAEPPHRPGMGRPAARRRDVGGGRRPGQVDRPRSGAGPVRGGRGPGGGAGGAAAAADVVVRPRAPRAARRARLERPGRRRRAPLGPRPDAVERALRRAPGRVDRPGRLSGLPDRPDAGHRPRPRASRSASAPSARAAVALLPLAAVALAFLLAGGALDWRGLSLFAVVLLAAYLLSLPIRHFWEGEQTVDVPTVQTAPAPLRQKFGAVLAAVVPFLVGIAVVRPSIVDVFATDDGSWFDRDMAALILGAMLAVLGSLAAATGVGAVIHWLHSGGRVRRWSLLAVLGVIVTLPSALLYLRSTSATVAQGFGSVAVVLVFLSGLSLVAAGLYVIGDTALRTRLTREAILPPSVRLLGFERPPLVGAVVLWLVLASLIGPGSYHDVRLQRRSEVDVKDVTLSEALTAWVERQPELSAGGRRPPDARRGGLGWGAARDLLDGARARLHPRARDRPRDRGPVRHGGQP